eukprot:TRINITY_DN399_c0_g2_i5.p1 TRINITY_DN399_c0_g2~~TRINITY_DN399_c0_g2_i5.p1  ORF type:complete len:736 (+),score=165.65 TRINITY_DN399_c0_g2_i5:173-2380(+)
MRLMEHSFTTIRSYFLERILKLCAGEGMCDVKNMYFGPLVKSALRFLENKFLIEGVEGEEKRNDTHMEHIWGHVLDSLACSFLEEPEIQSWIAMDPPNHEDFSQERHDWFRFQTLFEQLMGVRVDRWLKMVDKASQSSEGKSISTTDLQLLQNIEDSIRITLSSSRLGTSAPLRQCMALWWKAWNGTLPIVFRGRLLAILLESTTMDESTWSDHETPFDVNKFLSVLFLSKVSLKDELFDTCWKILGSLCKKFAKLQNSTLSSSILIQSVLWVQKLLEHHQEMAGIQHIFSHMLESFDGISFDVNWLNTTCDSIAEALLWNTTGEKIIALQFFHWIVSQSSFARGIATSHEKSIRFILYRSFLEGNGFQQHEDWWENALACLPVFQRLFTSISTLDMPLSTLQQWIGDSVALCATEAAMFVNHSYLGQATPECGDSLLRSFYAVSSSRYDGSIVGEEVLKTFVRSDEASSALAFETLVQFLTSSLRSCVLALYGAISETDIGNSAVLFDLSGLVSSVPDSQSAHIHLCHRWDACRLMMGNEVPCIDFELSEGKNTVTRSLSAEEYFVDLLESAWNGMNESIRRCHFWSDLGDVDFDAEIEVDQVIETFSIHPWGFRFATRLKKQSLIRVYIEHLIERWNTISRVKACDDRFWWIRTIQCLHCLRINCTSLLLRSLWKILLADPEQWTSIACVSAIEAVWSNTMHGNESGVFEGRKLLLTHANVAKKWSQLLTMGK